MPIKISKEPITFEVELEKSKFVMRELPEFEIAKIDNRYREGKDIPKEFISDYQLDIVTASMVDWKDIVDKKSGKDIPFEKELIRLLPMGVQADLLTAIVDRIGDLKAKKEKAEKNSETTSSKGQ